MGRIMSFGQDGRMVRDFDKSEHDFLRRYGRTPEEVMAENAKLIVKLNAEHIVRQNVEAENAKLRELAAGMYGLLAMFDKMFGNHDMCETPRPLIFGEDKSFKDVMRELGIEMPS